jgi:hypothetical protein
LESTGTADCLVVYENVAAVDEESQVTDFRMQFVERLNPDQDGFDNPPRSGQAKVFRPAGCWVYRVSPDQEKEFRQWVIDHLGLPELGRVTILGDFPMLRVFSPLDGLLD